MKSLSVLGSYPFSHKGIAVHYIIKEALGSNISDGFAGCGIMKLALITTYGFHLFLEGGGYIYYKCGFCVPVLEHVVDPLGAPGLLCSPIPFGLDLAEAGVETGICYEAAAAAMIRVAVVEGIGDDDLGAVMAYVPDEPALVLLIIAEEAIGHAGLLADDDTHYFGGVCGLCGPCGGCAPGAELALCKVKNTNGLPGLCVLDKRACTAQFNIIRVGCDGQYV